MKKNTGVTLLILSVLILLMAGCQSSSDSSDQPTSDPSMISEEVAIDETEDVSEDGTEVIYNLITNATFEESSDPWEFYAGEGEIVLSSVNGELYADITALGSEIYTPQFTSNKLVLLKDNTYTVTFRAKSDVARTINVLIEKSVAPYTGYSALQTIELTPEFQDYGFEFTMTQDSVDDGRLTFNVGSIDDGVSVATPIALDDIAVYNNAGEQANELDTVVEPLLSKAFDFTNKVVNGTFETDTEGWVCYLGGDIEDAGIASIDALDQVMVVTIEQLGSEISPPQVTQGDIPLKTGMTYQLDFTAYASTERTIVAAIDHATAEKPYIEQSVTLTKEAQDFSMFFDMEDDNVEDGRVVFNLGTIEDSITGTGTVTIDDVKLTGVELVWTDEFDEDGLPDVDNWSFEIANPGWVNNELQHYTDSIKNAEIIDGELKINMLKENVNGEDIYTSARVVTRNKADWLYGRFEIRAKLPIGKGTWPAIWMMPTHSVYGTWPNSGEMDILEYVGYQPGIVHGSVHSKNYYFKLGNNYTNMTKIENEGDYHLYSVDWTPNKVEISLDGLPYAIYEDGVVLSDGTKADLSTGWEAYPFNQEFYMILNVAFGGDWGGALGIDESIDKATMTVDYVRAYSYDFPVDEMPPTVPTDIAVSREVSTVIPLTWTASSDNYQVDSYEIYDDNGLVATSKSMTYEVIDLDPETDYSFMIRAVDHAGNYSDFSDLTTFRTADYKPYIVSKTEEVEAIVASEYEMMSGIMLETTNDVTGGKNVGYIDDGDYMSYIINVEEDGDYILTARVASGNSDGGYMKVEVGDDQVAEIMIQSSEGWQDWINELETVSLKAGDTIMKVTGYGYNLNRIAIGKEAYILE